MYLYQITSMHLNITQKHIQTGLLLIVINAVAILTGCKPETKVESPEVPEEAEVKVQAIPSFNSDSCYKFIAEQVALGKRVPNTKAHDACTQYLVKKLEQYGLKVTQQKGVVTAYDGTKLNITNIIAIVNPDAKKRILLSAHYDTRPFNDQDVKPDHIAIDGANDGGSGVAVILEIARLAQIDNPEVGLYILLNDAEDYGVPSFESEKKQGNADSYCLGTQFWAKKLDKSAFTANYGIVLDMVGGKNAKFFQEGNSREKAADIVTKVWNAAGDAGHRQHFIQIPTGGITDDHEYINSLAGIPCIDIIDFDENREKGFPDSWHTVADNMSNIDKLTLRAVGETVTRVIYTESPK